MIRKAITICIVGILITNCINAQSEATIVESNNNFAFDIFKEIIKTDTNNIFISPISISTALSMTYDGSKANTAKEMKMMLKFAGAQKKSHASFVKLLDYYSKYNSDMFTISNALVAQEKYPFKNSYFKLIGDYKAIVKTADFTNQESREAVRKPINDWVMQNTNQKIEDLLEKDALNELTRLVILNAIYFKADWKYEFIAERTKQMIFYGLRDVQYVTNFMYSRQKYSYFEDENLRILELPYKEEKASMYIIQPIDNKNFDEFCLSFSYDEFLKYENQISESLLMELFIPKFTISAKYSLKDNLKALGMVDAFSSKANFGNMDGTNKLMIDDVIHQSFVEVNEKGTEASAATAVVVREKSAVKTLQLLIDKPFVFLIKENSKKSILFVGKFVKP